MAEARRPTNRARGLWIFPPMKERMNNKIQCPTSQLDIINPFMTVVNANLFCRVVNREYRIVVSVVIRNPRIIRTITYNLIVKYFLIPVGFFSSSYSSSGSSNGKPEVSISLPSPDLLLPSLRSFLKKF